MSGLVTFVIIVGLVIVLLERAHRRRNPFNAPLGGDRSVDRDRERLIADLHAN